MKLFKVLPVLSVLFFTSFFESDAVARSGCCSHHGGPKSCDSRSGRMICMDGRYSPSCTCADMPYSASDPVYIPKPKINPPKFAPMSQATKMKISKLSSCKELYVKSLIEDNQGKPLLKIGDEVHYYNYEKDGKEEYINALLKSGDKKGELWGIPISAVDCIKGSKEYQKIVASRPKTKPKEDIKSVSNKNVTKTDKPDTKTEIDILRERLSYVNQLQKNNPKKEQIENKDLIFDDIKYNISMIQPVKMTNGYSLMIKLKITNQSQEMALISPDSFYLVDSNGNKVPYMGSDQEKKYYGNLNLALNPNMRNYLRNHLGYKQFEEKDRMIYFTNLPSGEYSFYIDENKVLDNKINLK